MRRLGFTLGIVVLLVLAALLIVPHFVDVNRYRGQIEAELQKQLGRPVTLGDMHLSLLPPSVRINGFSIAEDPSFGNGKFAQAQQLYVRVKLMPLLKKQVQIGALTLQRPVIELVRNEQGAWNFSTLGKQNQAQPSTAAAQPPQAPRPQPETAKPSAAPSQSSGQEFALDHLRIADGTIAVTDATKHSPRSVYDHIDATLNDYSANKPFTFATAAHLPGQGSQTIQLSGKAGPINQGNYVQTPFAGTLKLNNVQLAGIAKYLNSPQIENTDGVVSGTTDINNESGKISSRGSLNIKNAKVRGVEIGYPIDATYNVTSDLTSNLVTINQGDIKLGSTPLKVSGTLDAKGAPSRLDMRLATSNVSIADAAKLASAFGVAFDPKMKVAGQINADLTAKGPTSQPVLNGNASARDLVVSGGEIPEPVKIQAINLDFNPQQIRSNQFTLTSGATNVNGQFTVSQYATPAPNIDATLQTQNAQITNLIAMAKAYGVSVANGASGSGTLSLNVHAAGPIKNTNALSLNGNGAISDASVKPATMTQPLNIRNADIRFTSNSAVLSNLTASLGSTDLAGNVTVQNFAAPHVQFALSSNKVNVTELQQITANSNQQQGRQRAAARTGSWTIIPEAEAQSHPATVNAAQNALLAKMTGGGTLSVGTLQYDQLVLNNVKSNVTMNRGTVTMSPLTAQVYGGQESGQVVANLLANPMQVSVKTKLANVNANNLLSSVSSLKDTIYGMLSANTNMKFSAASSADIAKSLNGTLNINLTNGRIAKIDMLNQLAQIGKFVGLRKSGAAMTNVAKLTGGFNVVNGVAETNDLQAAIDGGTMAAAGTVNLASQELNMQVTAVLDKNVAQQAGGTSIGGFMQTALANNRGELVMPVLVTGTFDNPHFAPDMQKIADMKVKNLLPTLTNPGAGGVGSAIGSLLGGRGATGTGQPTGAGGVGGTVGNVLGALSGQQQQQQQQSPAGQPAQNQGSRTKQQQEPANPLGGLVDSITGNDKKKQNNPPQ